VYGQLSNSNQAFHGISQTPAEELSGEFPRTASPHFTYDFGRIPLNLPVQKAVKTKLRLNRAGDEYEQEAERVSEFVLRTPESQYANGLKRTGSANVDQGVAPPVVHEAVSSPGQLIEPATRSFMEPRLGHDFSKVRVHTDAKASRSASAVDALAYTVGHHIVFGEGQYAPASESGRVLIAHELVHVVQQSRSRPCVQRAPRTRLDVTPDELSGEMRQLLDHTQERFNHYVTQLRPHYRNPSKLGIEAAKYLQRDFKAVFGEGVEEVAYSLHGSEHRIDLFVSDYNLGIELKLSGAARAEQRRAFFYRAWRKTGEAEHTLAYVGAEGWWAGAGDKLSKAQLKGLRKDLARLEQRALEEVEEVTRVASKGERAGERAESRAAGKAGKSARTEATEAGKVRGTKGILGKAVSKGVTALGAMDLVQDAKSHDWIGVAKDAFSLVEPEVSLAADLASWGYHKVFGGGSEKSEPAQKPVEQPPLHRPIPSGHYFIVMGDGREIEVDAFALLNDNSAKPIYSDEMFPGEANQEWQKSRKFRLHREGK